MKSADFFYLVALCIAWVRNRNEPDWIIAKEATTEETTLARMAFINFMFGLYRPGGGWYKLVTADGHDIYRRDDDNFRTRRQFALSPVLDFSVPPGIEPPDMLRPTSREYIFASYDSGLGPTVATYREHREPLASFEKLSKLAEYALIRANASLHAGVPAEAVAAQLCEKADRFASIAQGLRAEANRITKEGGPS